MRLVNTMHKVPCVQERPGRDTSHLCCAPQSTGYCKTWAGEGDPTEGTVQLVSDIDFSIDIDTTTELEMVSYSLRGMEPEQEPALPPLDWLLYYFQP